MLTNVLVFEVKSRSARICGVTLVTEIMNMPPIPSENEWGKIYLEAYRGCAGFPIAQRRTAGNRAMPRGRTVISTKAAVDNQTYPWLIANLRRNLGQNQLVVCLRQRACPALRDDREGHEMGVGRSARSNQPRGPHSLCHDNKDRTSPPYPAGSTRRRCAAQ
jgi:hypothetical protein